MLEKLKNGTRKGVAYTILASSILPLSTQEFKSDSLDILNIYIPGVEMISKQTSLEDKLKEAGLVLAPKTDKGYVEKENLLSKCFVEGNEPKIKTEEIRPVDVGHTLLLPKEVQIVKECVNKYIADPTKQIFPDDYSHISDLVDNNKELIERAALEYGSESVFMTLGILVAEGGSSDKNSTNHTSSSGARGIAQTKNIAIADFLWFLKENKLKNNFMYDLAQKGKVEKKINSKGQTYSEITYPQEVYDEIVENPGLNLYAAVGYNYILEEKYNILGDVSNKMAYHLGPENLKNLGLNNLLSMEDLYSTGLHTKVKSKYGNSRYAAIAGEGSIRLKEAGILDRVETIINASKVASNK